MQHGARAALRMACNRSLSASASAPTLPPSARLRAQTPDTRDSRAGSGPARPRTRESSVRTAECGLEPGPPSGGKSWVGARRSRHFPSAAHRPGRAAGGLSTEGSGAQPLWRFRVRRTGPIYNQKGHKPMGDGPRHVFGTEVRASRPRSRPRLRLTTHLTTLTMVRLASDVPHASSPDAAATSEDQRRGLQGHGVVDVAWPRHLRAAGRLRATVPRCVLIHVRCGWPA